MSDISVIGLGNMGAALASSLVGAGLDVTVWNRSPGRTAPLAARGATAAPDARAALLASPRTLVCIADYPATTRLLDEAATNLDGRTLVQLSTGTPRQAADCDARVRALGGRYLDGAIMVNPTDIGSAGAQILIAGPEDAFAASEPTLRRLAGDLRYLGPNVRAAATLDMALLSRIECMVVGVVHGALICEAEGVPLEQFAALLSPGVSLTHLETLVPTSPHADAVAASVEVIAATVARLQEQARDAGINSEIPDFLAGLFDRAMAAGHAAQDSASVIHVLRRRDA